MLAARSGHLDIVKILLDNGANPRLKSDGNKLATDYTEDSDIQFAINIAIQKAQILDVQTILADNDSDSK